MSVIMKQWWPLWVAICGLGLAVGVLLSSAMQRTGGNFNYALDDAYIHLAIARNLAETGTWGVTRDAFSASTSSPAYTFLLGALIALSGQAEVWPFIINLLCAIALLFVCDRIFRRAALAPVARLVALCVIILLAPLPTLIFSGMEHVLHLLLMALLFGVLQDYPFAAPVRRRLLGAVLVITAAATMVRYETAFMTLSLAVYFAWRRDGRLAAGLIAATLIGPVLLGLLQWSQGWYFLPNSVLAKGANLVLNADFISSIFNRLVLNLARSSVLFGLAVVVAIWFGVRWRQDRRLAHISLGMALCFLVATTAQYTLAQVGWLYRYESYLIVFGCLLIFSQHMVVDVWRQFRARRLSLAAWAGLASLALALGLTGGYRIYHAWDDTPIVIATTYRQDNQMANFVARYFPNTTMIANDIGLIAYRSSARILDLDGLGSRASLEARRGGYYDAAFVERWAQDEGAQIAVIHDEFHRRLPDWPASWVRVGEWRVPDYFINSDAIIAFYAISPEAVEPLRAALRAFAPELPAPVQARIWPE